MKKTILLFFILALLGGILAGCQTVPYSGRNQLLITSRAEENKLGLDAWKEVKTEEVISQNKAYTEAVRRIGINIAAVAEQPDFEWEFVLFESKEANAFCLPGGKVGVYRGLLEYTSNDAELAAVIGHEIGHAIARHGGERMSQELIASIGMMAVSVATKGQTQAAAMVAYGLGSQYGVLLPYSRAHEYEADYIGLLLMAKAGYDPSAAVSFWQKFSQVSKDSSISEFFSTHPMSSKRIENMNEKLPEAMGYYNNAPRKLDKGEPIKWEPLKEDPKKNKPKKSQQQQKSSQSNKLKKSRYSH